LYFEETVASRLRTVSVCTVTTKPTWIRTSSTFKTLQRKKPPLKVDAYELMKNTVDR
jgi:hypothetical protein